MHSRAHILSLIHLFVMSAFCFLILPQVLSAEEKNTAPSTENPPETLSVLTPPGELYDTHDIIELNIQWERTFTDPFAKEKYRITAHFTAPSKNIYTADAFYTQDFTRKLSSGKELLTPNGSPYWKIRYSPREIGIYSWALTAHLGTETVWKYQGNKFRVKKGVHGGLIRVGKSGKYLTTEDDRLFFPVGLNLCWPAPSEKATFRYDTHFADMEKNHINFFRLWMCSWGMNLETSSTQVFDLKDAWRLDTIFRKAAERDIFIELCLDNFLDFTAREKRVHFPYWKSSGGTITEPSQFLTDDFCQAYYRKKIRYIIDRYAPYRSLMAWELWNEIDYAFPKDKVLLKWISDASMFIRKNDRYSHPVTVSLGTKNIWDELWKLPGIDIVQYHDYVHRVGAISDRDEYDGCALTVNKSPALMKFKKPVLFSEFGYNGTDNNVPMNDKDRRGILLHNGLWSSVLAGYAGSAAPWWWYNYIEPFNLMPQFRSLHTFIKGVRLNSPTARRIFHTFTSNSEFKFYRVIGIQDNQWAIFWIQNKKSNWYQIVANKQTTPRCVNAVFPVSGLTPANYKLIWFDTWKGAVLKEKKIRVESERPFQVSVPSFRNDIALKIEQIRRE